MCGEKPELVYMYISLFCVYKMVFCYLFFNKNYTSWNLSMKLRGERPELIQRETLYDCVLEGVTYWGEVLMQGFVVSLILLVCREWLTNLALTLPVFILITTTWNRGYFLNNCIHVHVQNLSTQKNWFYCNIIIITSEGIFGIWFYDSDECKRLATLMKK